MLQNKTYSRKKSISSYGDGELLVRGVHGLNDGTELLHEELQLAFVQFYVFCHQNCYLYRFKHITRFNKLNSRY